MANLLPTEFYGIFFCLFSLVWFFWLKNATQNITAKRKVVGYIKEIRTHPVKSAKTFSPERNWWHIRAGKIIKNGIWNVFKRGENLLQNGTLCTLVKPIVKNRVGKLDLDGRKTDFS